MSTNGYSTDQSQTFSTLSADCVPVLVITPPKDQLIVLPPEED
ncbi:hypothetical protein HMPREF0044_1437 [Gleimia coleocanis DSM 15436]|uniref:Uncharacterized protein n=1 Tax=Gleimia coleocanis DSM 15436 TaxID=525245 RepID=C0W293_9ACTO|nr:hypothetical protein [Gleimia coleocanis]EEH63198.1 hypothetical protein HMPREF0044_1437 [Gleimia coleocanis DSM 15436]